jgi:hypothetical protein
MMSCSRLIVLVVSILAALNVAAQQELSAVAAQVSYKKEVVPILMRHCAICHMKNEKYGYLTINEDSAYDALVGVPAYAMPNLSRVEPGAPEKSYLWLKLTGDYLKIGGKGWPMPPMSMLPTDKKNVILNWIKQGANNN